MAECGYSGCMDHPTDQPELVAEATYRKARKVYRCRAADPINPLTSRPNPNYRADCLGDINPGDTYIEYLGESAAYQSGYRYCRHCGLWNWQLYRDEVTT